MMNLKNTNLVERSPIVVILGHIDHGKSKLLDFIRKSNVVEKEAGGITQHIGAYQIEHNGKKITFLDTPGHEAFSAIRSRGANIADVAILVVAADEGVKPQTIEAIKHAKAANIPIIAAINKIDKPGANIAKVKEELANNDLIPEEWGGNAICVAISAKTGENIEELLENILLVAELAELRTDLNPKEGVMGVVIEATLHKLKGPLVTVITTQGVLKVGDFVFIDKTYGKIKGIETFAGQKVNNVLPSLPVVLMGLKDVPKAGDRVCIIKNEKEAKIKIEETSYKEKAGNKKTSEELLQELLNQKGSKPEIRIILKADVGGSLEALEKMIEDIPTDKVGINIIKSLVGNVKDGDVREAEISGADILGFNIEIDKKTLDLAERKNIEIKMYLIIYELIDEVKRKIVNLLPKKIIKTELGKIKVLALFKSARNKQVLGGEVIVGKAANNTFVDVFRGINASNISIDAGSPVGSGRLVEIQQNKVKVDEVPMGKECGLLFEGEFIVKEGDILLCYKREEIEQNL